MNVSMIFFVYIYRTGGRVILIFNLKVSLNTDDRIGRELNKFAIIIMFSFSFRLKLKLY